MAVHCHHAAGVCGTGHGLLGLGEFYREAAFQRLALGLGRRIQPFAGLGAGVFDITAWELVPVVLVGAALIVIG